MSVETSNLQSISMWETFRYSGRVALYRLSGGRLPRVPDGAPSRLLDNVTLDMTHDPDMGVLIEGDQRDMREWEATHGIKHNES